jgi:hypothetical protein
MSIVDANRTRASVEGMSSGADQASSAPIDGSASGGCHAPLA